MFWILGAVMVLLIPIYMLVIPKIGRYIDSVYQFYILYIATISI